MPTWPKYQKINRPRKRGYKHKPHKPHKPQCNIGRPLTEEHKKALRGIKHKYPKHRKSFSDEEKYLRGLRLQIINACTGHDQNQYKQFSYKKYLLYNSLGIYIKIDHIGKFINEYSLSRRFLEEYLDTGRPIYIKDNPLFNGCLLISYPESK